MRKTKGKDGITLIALVVTIVVLLILAGVSLNLVLGSNGIVTKSKEAVIENAHSTVYEALGVESSGFSIDVEAGNSKEDFLEYLYSKNLVNSNKVVNVPNLLGKSLKTGNGTEDDIYVITENETDGTYELEYKGTDKIASKNLGKIGYMTETDDEPSDESIFEFDKETGAIALKDAQAGYYSEVFGIPTETIKKKKIVVPSEIDGVKVTTIGIKKNIPNGYLESFYKGFGNSYVEEIVLPDTITKIDGPNMFVAGYNNPGVFQYCPNLKKINIPENVTYIAPASFRNCSSLESITLPNNLTSIEYELFKGCSKLKNINWGNSIKEIGLYAFVNCTSLEEVVMPNHITVMGESVFSGCTGLTSITFPSEIKSIPIWTLKQCTGLKTINLPQAITSIWRDNVEDCENLVEVNIPESNSSYCSIDGILYDKAKEKLVLFPAGLTAYNIPESVNNISAYTLIYAKKLREINVASGNSNFSSEDGVLFNKDKSSIICFPKDKDLVEYNIPNGVKEVGKAAFYNCTRLNKINIPEGATALNDSAFWNCTELTSIEIPNSVKTFGEYVLGYCTKLKTVVLPEGIDKIAYGLFYNCTSLEEVIIPEGVTSIDYIAFCECKELKSLTIPSSVTTIDSGAFSRDNNTVVTVKSGTSLTVDNLKKAGIKEENIHFE